MNYNTLIPKTPTTIGSWALLIAKAIESYGINSASIFSQVNIDLAKIQENPEVRLPVKQMALLWSAAVSESGDDCFALRVTQFFQPNTYSAVGLAFASSRSVMEGLEKSIGYFRMTTDAGIYSLEKNTEYVQLNILIPAENEPVAVEAIEAFMLTLVALSRGMITEDFSPLEVCFKHDRNAYQQQFEDFFQCPLHSNQGQYSLRYCRADLERPHMLANPALANTLEKWIVEHLDRFSEELVSVKVKAYILKHMLHQDVGLEHVASHFNLGVRTLQRKLKSENLNFNELIDECRHHMAIKLLAEQKTPLIDIAYILGFGDQSSFTRAFRRWTSFSPKRYRQEHGHKLIMS